MHQGKKTFFMQCLLFTKNHYPSLMQSFLTSIKLFTPTFVGSILKDLMKDYIRYIWTWLYVFAKFPQTDKSSILCENATNTSIHEMITLK